MIENTEFNKGFTKHDWIEILRLMSSNPLIQEMIMQDGFFKSIPLITGKYIGVLQMEEFNICLEMLDAVNKLYDNGSVATSDTSYLNFNKYVIRLLV